MTPRRRAPLVVATTTGVAVGAWGWAHLRSPAVQGWRPSDLPRARAGPLSYRGGGSGDAGFLLLHGLVATGDVFGEGPDRLAEHGLVAAPDLLGFGHSLDGDRTDFSSDAHLSALDGLVDEAFGGSRLRLGAHSMGSTLALRWAAAHPDRVERVVCLGAPMWASRQAALSALGATGSMARAFLLNEKLAHRICALSCAHRSVAGLLDAALAPRWPIPIARQASLHTWAAYRQALEQQVLRQDWAGLLQSLEGAGIRVELHWGTADRVGDPVHVGRVAGAMKSVSVHRVEGADHTLPAARPDYLPSRLTAG